jgi:hypothetical protein
MHGILIEGEGSELGCTNWFRSVTLSTINTVLFLTKQATLTRRLTVLSLLPLQ